MTRARLTRTPTLVGLGLLIFSLCFPTPRHARGPRSPTPLFSFGVMADIQYCDCAPKRTRHYRSALPKLAEAVTVLNARQLAFVIQLGDFIDGDFASFDAPMALYRQLDDAARRGQRIVLFSHFPIFPPHKLNLWNAARVKTLIESYEGVVAYLNGHNHKGHYEFDKGIHYLTLHGMAETPESNAFATVDVYPDHLAVVGYGREPSRKLALPRPW